MSGTIRPEVYGALSLAARHEATADRLPYQWRWRRARHLSKAQKLRMRAERLEARRDVP